MPYGILKVDTITFTNDGIDQSINISGIVASISGNLTATGTISGNVIRGGTTVSGATVTGSVGQFGNLTAVSGTFTTISGGTYTLASGVFASGTAANPSISFISDPNTGIYSPGADQVAISTSGTERMRIDSSGRLGINIASPGALLDVSGSGNIVRFGDGTNTFDVRFKGPNNWAVQLDTSADKFNIQRNSSPLVTVDSSGRLLVNTSSARSNLFNTAIAAVFQVEGTTVNTLSSFVQNSNDAAPANLVLGKSKGTTAGSVTVVSSGDGIGRISFQGADGSELVEAAKIEAEVDGTPGANDMPGRLIFSTTADGASIPTERMRIDSSGRLGLGTSSPQQELHINDATGISRIRLTGGAVGADNFEIGQAIPGVSNSGFSIYDVDATASRFVIDSSGNIGIGTTSPTNALHVNSGATGTSTILESTGSGSYLGIKNSSGQWDLGATSTNFILQNSGGEALRVDGLRRLLVGTSSGSSIFDGITPQFQIEGTGYNSSSASLFTNSNDANGAYLVFGKSRGTSTGSSTIVSSGDAIGGMYWVGADGTDRNTPAASIYAFVDGTPGANDMPGRLVFSVTRDGAASPTEAVRINNAGYLKATSTGSYISASGPYHEFVSGANDAVVFARNTLTSGYASYLYYGDLGATYNNTTANFLYFGDTSAQRLVVRSNGGIANYSANNVNLSDINAKKDISPASGTWNCLKEWEIVNFRYKDQPDDADLNMGVIAQQVAESCPEVITVFQEAKEATEDQPAQEERLGVKDQQMMWMAIKALQEAQLRIETLEAEVATLKAS